MKVIIKKTGQIKEVADGYARNFLLPNGEAVIATPEEVAKIEARQQKAVQDNQKNQELWKEYVNKMRELKISIVVKANEDGTLFGSISESDIVKALGDQGVKINQEWLVIEESIKKVGDHQISVKFPDNQVAKVNIQVSVN